MGVKEREREREWRNKSLGRLLGSRYDGTEGRGRGDEGEGGKGWGTRGERQGDREAIFYYLGTNNGSQKMICQKNGAKDIFMFGGKGLFTLWKKIAVLPFIRQIIPPKIKGGNGNEARRKAAARKSKSFFLCQKKCPKEMSIKWGCGNIIGVFSQNIIKRGAKRLITNNHSSPKQINNANYLEPKFLYRR